MQLTFSQLSLIYVNSETLQLTSFYKFVQYHNILAKEFRPKKLHKNLANTKYIL